MIMSMVGEPLRQLDFMRKDVTQVRENFRAHFRALGYTGPALLAMINLAVWTFVIVSGSEGP